MQDKARIIESILALNPSARAQWLDEFDVPALRRYLDHLNFAQEPRGAASVWVRDRETRAVVSHRAAA